MYSGTGSIEKDPAIRGLRCQKPQGTNHGNKFCVLLSVRSLKLQNLVCFRKRLKSFRSDDSPRKEVAERPSIQIPTNKILASKTKFICVNENTNKPWASCEHNKGNIQRRELIASNNIFTIVSSALESDSLNNICFSGT